MAAVTGAPVNGDSVVPRLLNIGLAVYSVGVFASLAAALGAFFLDGGDRRGRTPDQPRR